MTTLTELKTKADDLGIDRGIVRLYGDLRKIETWEKAVTAYNTVTVEAETIIDEVEEIIPFTDDEWFTKELELVYLAIPQDHPISFQEIFAKTNLPSGELSLKLLDLELAEMVIQEPKGFYSQLHDEYDKYLGFTVGDQVEAKCCYAFLNKGDEGFVPMIIKQIFFESNNLRFRVQRIDDEKTGFYCGIDAIRLAVDCPPPPPIVRPCPTPEIPQTIPGVEIAERESPSPGEGRGDERFRNLGDRLGEKIKLDIFKYLDAIHAWIFEQYSEFDRLTQYEYFSAWYEIERFQRITPEKIKIYEFIEEAIALVTTIKQNHIPWYLQQDMPAPPVWCETKQDNYYLLLEKPTPIPTLSIDYDGQFIPNCFHELGVDIYCFLFPNQLRAEEYFEQITEAKHYQFIPASQPQPQLLLAGV